ncbi:MAG TPA: class I SAM-dependent methyltransferase [Anaerolineales bacterium]
MPEPDLPVCDYEGSDYQTSFWERGGRDYEDRVEGIALKRLLPAGGNLLLELGAGAGRNTPRYAGFRRIVLLDYSRTQLEQAQARLGISDRYVYVAADIYQLPFVAGLFDAATMIRVLHHMADAPRALAQVHRVLGPDATFILEFANKRNIKAILRYCAGLQKWSPFTPEPVEFAKLNFDFHPEQVRAWLTEIGMRVERKVTVSHFRAAVLKKIVPTALLALLDSVLQRTGELWQLTPSVFFKIRGGNATAAGVNVDGDPSLFFSCPACGGAPLAQQESRLTCPDCGKQWSTTDGIFDFRQPVGSADGPAAAGK